MRQRFPILLTINPPGEQLFCNSPCTSDKSSPYSSLLILLANNLLCPELLINLVFYCFTVFKKRFLLVLFYIFSFVLPSIVEVLLFPVLLNNAFIHQAIVPPDNLTN